MQYIDYQLITWLFCDPAGTRTQDPNIKSVMLYQLSYGIIPFLGAQKYGKKGFGQIFEKLFSTETQRVINI